MNKIEMIWREILFQAIEKKNYKFMQKDLAKKFGFSTSTIFQALKVPRKMGAVEVRGRFFTLEDAEKILYHWASARNLEKDIIFRGRVEMNAFEIEGNIPPDSIFAGYSAARMLLSDSPSDYDKVYLYGDSEEIKKRFKFTKGEPNLFVLKKDEFMGNYGQTTTLAQTFVDLWNIKEWYAKEFTKALKEKIDGLLP